MWWKGENKLIACYSKPSKHMPVFCFLACASFPFFSTYELCYHFHTSSASKSSAWKLGNKNTYLQRYCQENVSELLMLKSPAGVTIMGSEWTPFWMEWLRLILQNGLPVCQALLRKYGRYKLVQFTLKIGALMSDSACYNYHAPDPMTFHMRNIKTVAYQWASTPDMFGVLWFQLRRQRHAKWEPDCFLRALWG